MTGQLVEFSVNDAEIAQLKEYALTLRVAGVEDKKGLAAVHGTRMKAREMRVTVEKVRVRVKTPFLDKCRQIDEEAKRLSESISEIEEHCKKQEDAIEAEKARIKRAAEEAHRRTIVQRMERLHAVRSTLTTMEVEAMDAGAFEVALARATADHEEAEEKRLAEAAAEAERLAKLEQERAAEEERRKAERAELEAAQAVQRAKEEELEREREKIATQKAAAEDARVLAEQLAAQKRQEEQAKIDADRQALEREREESARKVKEEAERQARNDELRRMAELEEARRVELLPDRQKVAKYVAAIEAVTIPACEFTESISALRVKYVADLLKFAE